MAELVFTFSFYTTSIGVPLLAIIGILFHLKNRTKSTFVFASGLLLMVISQIIVKLSPAATAIYNDSGTLLSSSGPSLGYYVGTAIFPIGLVITIVGLVLVTYNLKLIPQEVSERRY